MRDLGASGSDLQWIIDAYVIVFASLLLTAGALGDKFGRKGALAVGLAALRRVLRARVVGDQSPEMLIAARGLMGIGAAFIFPTTLSILTNTFTGHERAKAIGVWAGVSGIGVALGPMLGGILVEHFYWGAVFFVNVPICALALVLGYFFIPTSRDPDNRPLDPVGALLSILTLVALLYSIIQAPEKGWTAPEVVVAFVVGLVLLGVFAWWEMHTKEPMIDVRVFRNPRFSAASSVLTLTSFALYGSVFLLIQYFQFVLGYSPLEAGLLAMPVAIGDDGGRRRTRRASCGGGARSGSWCSACSIAAVAMLLYGSDTIMSSFVGGCAVRLLFGIGLGLTLGTGDRVDHGIAAAEPGRRRLRDQRHHPPDRRRARRRHHRQRVPRRLPPLRRQGAAPLGRVVGRGARLGGPRRSSSPATSRPSRARRSSQLSRDAFVDAMRITYPIAAAFIVFAAVIAWRFLPAHGHDEFATDDDAEEAREISEFEILGA